MHALDNENVNCLETLIEAGANLHILNCIGHTALTLAIGGSHSSVSVDKLIKAGANVNFMPGIVIIPLYIAVIRGKIDIVKKLINAGVDLNYSGSDPPPLCAAAQDGPVDCVKELIQAGADLNTVDMHGNTPLMTADKYFSFNCVSTLFKAGAEIDTTNLVFMAIMILFAQSPNSEGTVRNADYKNVVREG